MLFRYFFLSVKLFLVVAHDQIVKYTVDDTIAKDADGEREEREISWRRRKNAIHAIPCAALYQLWLHVNDVCTRENCTRLINLGSSE